MSVDVCRRIEVIFHDIDDTLTFHGKIPAAAFSAIWQAHEAGIKVVPITGRPAGWCDHLARMWPVAAVVGENGALAFSCANQEEKMRRIYSGRPVDAAQRLEQIRTEVLAAVPRCKIAADQAYREYDLAVDISEEVPKLNDEEIDRIVEIFQRHGAIAKISSIHINGYFGQFDKLTMCLRCASELLGAPLDADRATFLGDSPNDEPMFKHFPHAIGVANVRQWTQRMTSLPTYVTDGEGGHGFAQALQHILAHR